MERKVKVGVIGLGTMGTTHIKTMQAIDNCLLTAVCDIYEDKSRQLFNDGIIGSNTVAFTDYRKLIDSGLCEAVAVVTPHPLHLETTIYALKSGLHVMCDKPVTTTVSEADIILSAWEKTNLKFSTMYSMRTNPLNKIIKEWMDDNKLGVIRRAEMNCTDWLRTQDYYNSQSWRGTWKGEGGGLLMNQAPHNLDLLSWWFGPASVIEAWISNRFHDIETEDEVSSTIWMEAGFPVTFYANTAEAPGRDYLEIVGDKGTMIKNNGKLLFKKLESPLSETIKHSHEMFPVIKAEDIYVEIPDSPRGHKVVFENFFDTIINDLPNESMISPGNEGINAVEWANAMLLSAFTQESIKLPLNRSAYDDLLNKLKSKEFKLSGNIFRSCK